MPLLLDLQPRDEQLCADAGVRGAAHVAAQGAHLGQQLLH